jgi:hypothetical protein
MDDMYVSERWTGLITGTGELRSELQEMYNSTAETIMPDVETKGVAIIENHSGQSITLHATDALALLRFLQQNEARLQQLAAEDRTAV